MPIRPIIDFDKNDERFIKGENVLDSVSDTNLATMDWQDFEHLIRELFEKEFSNSGAEVRVTSGNDPSETFVHARGRFPSGLFRNDMSMVLTNASDADIPELMTWFHDARSTQEWGGWVFRFPFDDKTFREDVQLSELDSFVAHSESTELIAFGQVRNKYGRGHLARLAVAPKHRGRGLGRDLVTSLCQKATELFACSEISLFVSKTNAVAIRCYKGLGFHEAPYPEDRDMGHKTLFMVRKIASN